MAVVSRGAGPSSTGDCRLVWGCCWAKPAVANVRLAVSRAAAIRVRRIEDQPLPPYYGGGRRRLTGPQVFPRSRSICRYWGLTKVVSPTRKIFFQDEASQ